MTTFARALARIAVAAGVSAAGIVAAQAAGALAVGPGAYGLPTTTSGRRPPHRRARQLQGAACKIVTAMRRSCAAFASTGTMFAARTAMFG
jgi:hypothetical protein